MNYIGSKVSLLSFLEESIKEAVGDISDKVFFDLFAGTGAVGSYFNNKVKSVYANDFEYYSLMLNYNLLLQQEQYDGLHDLNFDRLNNLEPTEGFIWRHYSPAGGRMYFTEENAKKIDAMREDMFNSFLRVGERVHLLASLIESADRVANTTSVYGAYLKKFKSTAIKELVLKPSPFTVSPYDKNKVFQEPAEAIVGSYDCDILYLDPPYNSRQYGANYHLLNTISRKEKFEPQGVTGLPEIYNKSAFCSKRTVMKSFNNLISNAKAEHIFLSYNNEGLMSIPVIKSIMERFGEYSLFTKEDYKRYKADSNREYKADSTTEYLHHLRKK